MNNLVDIGANLTHDSFDEDFQIVLARAIAAGVTQIIVTGASVEDSVRALALANKYPQTLLATAGIHPHHAKDVGPESFSRLKALCQHDKVRAVGETGLDFFRNFSLPSVQEDVFEAHLELARELQMPLFIHDRDAHPRLGEILAACRDKLDKVVVHCFTGDAAALHTYLDLDCYIGITGWICDERRGGHLLSLVKLIPHDRLLVETDAPYLLPRNLDPKPKTRRNEPCYLPQVVKTLAKALDTTVEQLAQQTTTNARAFFAIDERDLT